MKETHRGGDLTTDLLNISGELIPELDAELSALLDRGKHEKIEILRGTEGGKARKPYAVTHIEIDFESEQELRNCVRLLRWSDDRLRASRSNGPVGLAEYQS